MSCCYTFAKIVAQVLAFAGEFCEQPYAHSAVDGLFSQKIGVLRIQSWERCRVCPSTFSLRVNNSTMAAMWGNPRLPSWPNISIWMIPIRCTWLGAVGCIIVWALRSNWAPYGSWGPFSRTRRRSPLVLFAILRSNYGLPILRVPRGIGPATSGGNIPPRFDGCMGIRTFHIPTKQKRRSTGQGAQNPLDHQRPAKNGSQMAHTATSFRTPSACHGCRRLGGCRPGVDLFHAMG
jgi:hypothetical protein